MVRPKKKVTRNLELRVRVTDKERQTLAARAEKAGKNLADYVRSKLGLDQEGYGSDAAGGSTPGTLVLLAMLVCFSWFLCIFPGDFEAKKDF